MGIAGIWAGLEGGGRLGDRMISTCENGNGGGSRRATLPPSTPCDETLSLAAPPRLSALTRPRLPP